MARPPADRKQPDVFTDDPPEWAHRIFSYEQIDRLTYTKLWQKSVAASALPKATKLVALALSLYFSGNQEDENNPSTARLADETSMHRSTVIAQLDALDEAGFIERLRSAGRVRTRYRLTVPDDLPIREQPSDSATVGTDDGYGSVEGQFGGQLSDSESQLSDSPSQLSDSAPPTVGPSDLKGLEGFSEGKPKGGGTDVPPCSPNGEPKSPVQNEDQENPGGRARRLGMLIGRDPNTDRRKAGEMLKASHSIPAAYADAFWEGYDQARHWIPEDGFIEPGAA